MSGQYITHGFSVSSEMFRTRPPLASACPLGVSSGYDGGGGLAGTDGGSPPRAESIEAVRCGVAAANRGPARAIVAGAFDVGPGGPGSGPVGSPGCGPGCEPASDPGGKDPMGDRVWDWDREGEVVGWRGWAHP